MTDYTAWLGPAADELTADQLDAFTTAADDYYALPLHGARDPEDDAANAAEDDYALTAILQAILREGTLRQAAAQVREAEAARDGWIRASAAMGIPEGTIADRAGVTRVTVRKRLGK